ncbi:hypothetical protein FDJ19_gp173 [Vibrio phage Ceto]|uniref:Uncharacterized protein n=1 Tax=Vibrio phage Ceto TaxID=2570300 RepID=A0A2H5BGL2_9CAUD|nr:hypothetical protein FDJ19_gp173 [Vibrio phage Ceto]AUG85125.1 hypothetical protein CETO_143 [Vibrio phage Ceto]
MGFGPAYGTGRGGGAVDIFTKKDGNPAIFANTGARDTYFTTNPDELAKVKSSGNAVAIGTTDQITAAYVYKNNAWQAIATNFKGDKGAPGAPGDGIDYSHLEDNQLPKWDSKAKMFVSSGILSQEDGEIRMAPNSLTFGHHKMSSAIADVTFTNLGTNENYSFVYQTMNPGDKDAYIREIDSNIEEIVRVPVGTDDVVNPSNTVTVDVDEIFLGGTFILSQDTQDVLMEVYNFDNPTQLIWRDNLGDMPSGENTVTFDTPFKCRAGFKYIIHLLSKAGDLVAKGSGSSFSWKINRAKMYIKKVASQDWVNEQPFIDDVTLTGNMFTFTMANGATKSVTLPPATGGVASPYDFTSFNSDKTPVLSEVANSTPVYHFNGLADSTFTLPSTDILPPNKNIALLIRNASPNNSSLSVVSSGTDFIDRANIRTLNIPQGMLAMFISDYTRDLWHMVPLDSASSGQNLNTNQIVKSIQPTASGNGLVTTYYDDTSITTTFDPWVSDINKLNDAVDTLQRQLKSKTRYYVYKGSNTPPPDIPTGARGGYYFTFTGTSADVVLPAPSRTAAIADGTILFVDNNSTSYKVTVTTSGSDTIAGGTKVDLPAESAAWYVRNGNNWQELYSGYLPESHKKLIDEIKTLISASNTFMRDVGVQGDDPNAGKVECTELEFHKCKVTQDTTVPTKGIVKFEGTTFVNPDGSKITTDVIKLVGMELVDPLDGTPPKLLLHGSGNLPTPHPTSGYGFFSDSASTPDTVNLNSLPVFRNGRVSIHKDTTDPQYAYILLPPGEGTDADRIGELGGLPSYWAKSEKIYNIGGVSRTYTVFRSPYPFKEQDVTLIIYH